jgi:hypothetical protein
VSGQFDSVCVAKLPATAALGRAKPTGSGVTENLGGRVRRANVLRNFMSYPVFFDSSKLPICAVDHGGIVSALHE